MLIAKLMTIYVFWKIILAKCLLVHVVFKVFILNDAAFNHEAPVQLALCECVLFSAN